MSDDVGYELELFIKSSKDGKGLGDCIHCHRFMMVLALKGVTANVTTIDLRRKPEFFVKYYAGVKLPCLVHNGKVIDDIIEIESHIEKHFPDPPLVLLDDHGASKAGEKIFQKFSALIRNRDPAGEERLRDSLNEELQKLDAFLASSKKIPGPYLAGNEMTMSDCVLLPKLHQMQITLKFFNDFSIPKNLVYLQNYLKVANENEVFVKTCCETSEILEGWSAHVGDPKKVQKLRSIKH
ncbi:chloride intracellular channel protein 5 isoform X1 [Hydra vulgaris]|uniref:chloride intracellular channel protein 5 isoform X1 n=2 Tax=Hydra vulgaris TaxID=6087 RepID=UPI0001925A19|nr:chloride intracellular channel protein 5 isoform X1 [Hydra vulgaris]